MAKNTSNNGDAAKTGPLRHLHAQVHRGRAGAGVQLPGRPARGRRGLHPQPDRRGLDTACPTSTTTAASPAATWNGRRCGACWPTSQAGKVDCVVVYKVDRLSRSLLRLRQDDGDASRSTASRFVSVTQQFNTTTSLGRLTLNILLSFAQFEREIISERTRDKQVGRPRRGASGPAATCSSATTSTRERSAGDQRRRGRAVRQMFRLVPGRRTCVRIAAKCAASGAGATSSGPHRTASSTAATPCGDATSTTCSANTLYTGRIQVDGEIVPRRARGHHRRADLRSGPGAAEAERHHGDRRHRTKIECAAAWSALLLAAAVPAMYPDVLVQQGAPLPLLRLLATAAEVGGLL